MKEFGVDKDTEQTYEPLPWPSVLSSGTLKAKGEGKHTETHLPKQGPSPESVWTHRE